MGTRRDGARLASRVERQNIGSTSRILDVHDLNLLCLRSDADATSMAPRLVAPLIAIILGVGTGESIRIIGDTGVDVCRRLHLPTIMGGAHGEGT